MGRAEVKGVAVGDDSVAQTVLKLQSGQGGTVVSTALNMTNGQGIPSAWCYLFREDGTLYEHGQTRSETGVMIIPNVPAGRYRAQVSALGFSVSAQSIFVAAGQTIQLEDVLYQAGALRWALKYGDGNPAVGIRCTLVPVDSASIEEPREGVTNQDGVFISRGLYPGDYTATALPKGRDPVAVNIRIFPSNASDAVTQIP